jgi:hypothetical protein
MAKKTATVHAHAPTKRRVPAFIYRALRIYAWTRAEARAAAKRHYGHRDRLPVGESPVRVA